MRLKALVAKGQANFLKLIIGIKYSNRKPTRPLLPQSNLEENSSQIKQTKKAALVLVFGRALPVQSFIEFVLNRNMQLSHAYEHLGALFFVFY